jgi:hypothetical protein
MIRTNDEVETSGLEPPTHCLQSTLRVGADLRIC